MSMRRAVQLSVAIVCLWCAQSANALCALCVCTVSTTPVVFLPHNPLSASNNDSTGNVKVTCGGVASIGLTYTVAMSAGTSGAMGTRQMASGSNRLGYNVYTSNTYGTIWGDGSGTTAMVNGGFALDAFGLAPAQNITVYARIPGSQTSVAPGSYADTLVVTLTYF